MVFIKVNTICIYYIIWFKSNLTDHYLLFKNYFVDIKQNSIYINTTYTHTLPLNTENI